MASSVDYDDNERIINIVFQEVSRGIKKKPFTSKVKGLTPKGGECVATAEFPQANDTSNRLQKLAPQSHNLSDQCK
jgi:hypothetical protein